MAHFGKTGEVRVGPGDLPAAALSTAAWIPDQVRDDGDGARWRGAITRSGCNQAVAAFAAAFFFVRERRRGFMARRKDGTRRGSLPLRIIASKNRKAQVAPTTRKLFDDAAKAEFLEWFAATCNLSLAARKTGFHYRTVIRHWRADAAFGAACRETLEIAYLRLEALALQAAAAALDPARRFAVDGEREAPTETLAMSVADALQLLREHKRGVRGGPPKAGRAPAAASNDEVIAALVKRLQAFGLRDAAERALAAAQGGGAGGEAADGAGGEAAAEAADGAGVGEE
jgi:hypothetical protein